MISEKDQIFKAVEENIDELNLQKLCRCGVQIERFNYDFITGYPPTHFLPIISGNNILNDIFNNANKINSAYIHIPFCSGYCSYCYFYKIKDLERIDTYLKFLEKEAEIIQKKLGEKISLSSLYIGGGTPSLLKENQIEFLFESVCKKIFIISKEAEITFEAHPSDLINNQKLQKLKEFGVNRVSFGTQTFDSNLLIELNRRHNKDVIIQAIKNIEKNGFPNWNVDFMYGFPRTSLDSIFEDLKIIIASEIPSITFYRVEINKQTRLWYKNKKDFLEEKDLIKMTALIFEMMKKNGYLQDNVNWFVKNREFTYKQQSYKWKNNYFIGLGPSSYFYINDYYCQNVCDLETYFAKINSGIPPIEKAYKLDIYEKMRRAMVLGIKLTDGVDVKEFKNKYDKTPEDIFPETLDKLKRLDLIEITNSHIKLTPKGLLFADNVAESFFSERFRNEVKINRSYINKEVKVEIKFSAIKNFQEELKFLTDELSNNIVSEDKLKKYLDEKWKSFKNITNNTIKEVTEDNHLWWVYQYWSCYHKKRISFWAYYKITESNVKEENFIKKLEEWYYNKSEKGTKEVIPLYWLIFERPKNEEQVKGFYPKCVTFIRTKEETLVYSSSIDAGIPTFFIPWFKKIENGREELKNKLKNVTDFRQIIDESFDEWTKEIKKQKTEIKFDCFRTQLSKYLGKDEIKDIEEEPFIKTIIFLQLIDPKANVFYYITSQILLGSSSGGFLISCEREIKELIPYLWIVSNFLGGRLGIIELELLAAFQSLKSAVAAIMARNMSHNIGSHVLNYLSNPEELDNLWII